MDDLPDITIHVPTTTGFSVLFPGYIQDVGQARSMLPNEEALASSHHNNASPITLTWRPEDDLSHPLTATRHGGQNLLILRIQQQPNGTMEVDGTPSVTVEAVAHCTTCYAFEGMADFQYLPEDPRPEEVPRVQLCVSHHASRAQDWQSRAHPMCEGPEVVEVPPLLVVPPTFATTDQPFAYDYVQHISRGAVVDHRAPGTFCGYTRFCERDTRATCCRQKAGASHGVQDKRDPHLPLPAHPASRCNGVDCASLVHSRVSYPHPHTGLDTDMVERLHARLLERPVWSEGLLEEAMQPQWGQRALMEAARKALMYQWGAGAGDTLVVICVSAD